MDGKSNIKHQNAKLQSKNKNGKAISD